MSFPKDFQGSVLLMALFVMLIVTMTAVLIATHQKITIQKIQAILQRQQAYGETLEESVIAREFLIKIARDPPARIHPTWPVRFPSRRKVGMSIQSSLDKAPDYLNLYDDYFLLKTVIFVDKKIMAFYQLIRRIQTQDGFDTKIMWESDGIP